jgi:uncharacterized membrane protein SpoIIM required for sporulation
MTPRQFEAQYQAVWAELEAGLQGLERRRRQGAKAKKRVPADATPTAGGARIAQLYRQSCEHLALARERAYPVHLVARLETLTAQAHQRIYRRHDDGLAALRELVLFEIPAAVRALRWHLLVATLVFVVPLVALGIATWRQPHLVLTMADAGQVREFDAMYGPAAAGHPGRTSGDDWQMFGFYILNNIGLAFQCFATGLTFGVASLLMLAYNGAMPGALAGFLVTRGDAERFFSFVCTHAAFELTAIVLAGACGLKLGHAMLAPGRLSRTEALRKAGRDTTPVMVGAFAMLLIAAAIEAFWSSAGWIAPAVKYGVAACCWTLVFGYLGLQGRNGNGNGDTTAPAPVEATDARPR